MNIGVHVSFQISVLLFSDILPRSGIAGSYGSSSFSFLRTSILFSTVAAQIYIPTNNVQGFPFSHILANICYLCSFWWWPFWQMWGDISLWFWFAFSWWLVLLNIFSRACWPSVFLLWKNVYSVLLPIFNWVVCFLMFSCMSCLYMLDGNPLLVISLVNIFSYSVSCLFIFSMVSFAVQKLLRDRKSVV